MPSASQEFTLELIGFATLTDDLETLVAEAGCTDGLLFARDGHVFLEFAEASPRRRSEAIQELAAAGVSARSAADPPAHSFRLVMNTAEAGVVYVNLASRVESTTTTVSVHIDHGNRLKGFALGDHPSALTRPSVPPPSGESQVA